MASLRRIPTIAILCIFVEAIQQVRQLGRGREKGKKATENDIGGLAVKIDVTHTNSFM